MSRVVEINMVIQIVQHEMFVNKTRFKRGEISLEEYRRTFNLLDAVIDMSKFNAKEKE